MNERRLQIAIAIVSMAVPLLVVLLVYGKPPDISLGVDVKLLPALNAALNFTTAILLVAGYIFIRRKEKGSHRLCMISAFTLSVLFFVSYIVYHALAEETRFGGTGPIRSVYYTILISHIILSAAIVPMVLITLVRALSKKFDRHRRIARWTFPIWLYVTLSGVAVYLMLRPYY